jgi:hypothetical protein
MRSHRSFVAIMVASLITLASPQVLAKTFGKTVKVENCQIVEISKGKTKGACPNSRADPDKFYESTETSSAPIGNVKIDVRNDGGLELECMDDTMCLTSTEVLNGGEFSCSRSTKMSIKGSGSVSKDLRSAAKYALTVQASCAREHKQKEVGERQRRDEDMRSRRMCEAQKATCFASCPPYRSVSARENSLEVNAGHFDCKRRCESISCY